MQNVPVYLVETDFLSIKLWSYQALLFLLDISVTKILLQYNLLSWSCTTNAACVFVLRPCVSFIRRVEQLIVCHNFYSLQYRSEAYATLPWYENSTERGLLSNPDSNRCVNVLISSRI